MSKFQRVAAGLALFCAAGMVCAQGGPSVLQFSFSNPGARSLGLGGAFAALADDATAAFANPAGLVQLTRPEVSLEGRYWSYTTPFTEGGRVLGDPTGILLDTPLRVGESGYDTAALSFVSLVYPGRRWTVALSRHQLADFEARSQTQGLFTDDTEDDPQPTCLEGSGVCRYPDFRRSTRIDVVTYAASAAVRLSDAFSFGLGVSYFQNDLFLTGDGFAVSGQTLPQGFFGPNPYADGAQLIAAEFATQDSDWGLSAGFLWFITRQWSFGGFFRSGASVEFTGVERSGPALDPPLAEGTVLNFGDAIPFRLPDVYGLGLAYRSPNGTWTAGFEWDRVEYSTLVRSIPPSDLIDTSFVTIDDADELHLGAEYVFRDLSPIVALRGGWWRDPDHTVRSFEDDPLERALLSGGEDKMHYALGAGIAFKSFQIDLAFDLCDLIDTASISFIYGF